MGLIIKRRATTSIAVFRRTDLVVLAILFLISLSISFSILASNSIWSGSDLKKSSKLSIAWSIDFPS